MRKPAVPWRVWLLCLAGLLVPPAALGQQTNTLQQPAKKTAEPVAPKPPTAAPRTPVQQAKPSSPPVVVPHGPSHPQKPGAKTAQGKQPAKTETKPAPPPPPPVEQPAPPPAKPPEPEKGSATGLPLPRFASLRSDDVNLRAGPGTRYPIEWVYKRRDLPIEIEREFEVWRLIRDPDGTRGWVHQATLTGHRSFIVESADATLRSAPQDTARPIAILKPGVVGRLRSCDAGSEWCQAQAGNYRGYLKRSQIWGVGANEAVAP